MSDAPSVSNEAFTGATITGTSPEPVEAGAELTINGTGLAGAQSVDSTVGDAYFPPFDTQSNTQIALTLHHDIPPGPYNIYVVDANGNGSNMYPITVVAAAGPTGASGPTGATGASGPMGTPTGPSGASGSSGPAPDAALPEGVGPNLGFPYQPGAAPEE